MRNFNSPTLLALALTFAFGCSKPDVVVTDINGNKTTVSKDGTKMSYTDPSGKTTTMETDPKTGSMTMKDDKGTTNIETGTTLTEAELGLPFYPGSTERANSSFKAVTAEERDAMSVRITGDETAKVIGYYKSKVKEPSTMSMSDDKTDRQMLTGKSENGAKVTVTAVREKGKSETEVSVSTVLALKK